MSETNQTTINSYNEHVQEYIDGTPQQVSEAFKTWIDEALVGLPADAKIFEIGSAFGRDAEYIEARGFNVERSDGSEGFVTYLEEHGHKTLLFNALRDDFPAQYNLIFASAVLLHFNREETAGVIAKVHGALKAGGRFAFSLKQGEGEEWSEVKLGAPRYFCYWTAEGISMVLEEAGFKDVWISDDIQGSNAKWLQIIAHKN